MTVWNLHEQISCMSAIVFSPGRSRTFRPKRHIPEGTKQSELLARANATLGSGNLKQAVMLPEGEDLNEWIAVNSKMQKNCCKLSWIGKIFVSIPVVDFFNQISMLYGTITEYCTLERCPVMSAGPKYEYHWADGNSVKKPIKCSAPQYIDFLMTWVQDQLDDETVFPSKIGNFV